jgi:transposase InsO family protein
VEVLADERGEAAVGFLRRAVTWFAERRGVVERRTQPYRPRTNGKAERFIQTMLREWAYGRLDGSSATATTTDASTAPSATAPRCRASTSCSGTTWLGTTARPPTSRDPSFSAFFRTREIGARAILPHRICR